MARKTIVKLSGFRELDKALSELGKATTRGVLKRTAFKALEPMRLAAEEKAPRRTGALAVSIDVSDKRTKRASRMNPKRKGYYEAAMGPATGNGVLNYATFDEFGTVDTPPQPYMRPAWIEQREGALDIVKQELAVEIDKAAKRVAKKKAKSGG